jgi:hypothetical protein
MQIITRGHGRVNRIRGPGLGNWKYDDFAVGFIPNAGIKLSGVAAVVG